MKNRIILLAAIIVAVGLLAVAVSCKREPPEPPAPPTPPPAPVSTTPPAPPPADEPEVPIPTFSEQAYVDIAAEIDFLRSKYPDNEPKVGEELIKFVAKYGFIVKDERELESAMIGLSKQLEDLIKTKGPGYQKEIEEKVNLRIGELMQEDLEKAQEAENQPPEEPQPPEEQPK